MSSFKSRASTFQGKAVFAMPIHDPGPYGSLVTYLRQIWSFLYNQKIEIPNSLSEGIRRFLNE